MNRAAAGRWLRWFLVALLIVLAAVQAWYVACVVYWKSHNPGLTSFMRHAQERLAARHPPGTLQHQWIAYGQISNE